MLTLEKTQFENETYQNILWTKMGVVRKSLEKLWMLYMEATLDDSGGSGEGIAWEMGEGERGKGDEWNKS